MSARLIVNADDFGLTPGVNRAVAELHSAGIVCSATLMATGAAFQDAVEIGRTHPALGIGCHIVLTDGEPVSRPESLPTLLGADRRFFRRSLGEFLRAVVLGRIDPDEVRQEAVAQIRKLQGTGLRVTHIDTHKHTHILPQIARPLIEAALETGVPAIRNPFEQLWSMRLGHPGRLRRLAVGLTGPLQQRFYSLPALRDGRVHTTDGTIGISATGRLDEPTLREIVAALPEGTWELVCHPGYNDHDLDRITTRLRASREIERRALLRALSLDAEVLTGSPAAERPQRVRPHLIHYGRLLDKSPDREPR